MHVYRLNTYVRIIYIYMYLNTYTYNPNTRKDTEKPEW